MSTKQIEVSTYLYLKESHLAKVYILMVEILELIIDDNYENNLI